MTNLIKKRFYPWFGIFVLAWPGWPRAKGLSQRSYGL